VHAHLFRHGYAVNFLNCGGRLDALQEQLGHRDINTTRIYLRLSDEDVKPEVGKIQCSSCRFWPFGKFTVGCGGDGGGMNYTYLKNSRNSSTAVMPWAWGFK
jgi:hypothetical protein